MIENLWRVKKCPSDGSGCDRELEDSQYGTAGQCIKRNYCIGTNARPDKNCLPAAELCAWTSPIFLEYR